MIVFAEHRYYGDSMPYGNKSMQQPYISFLTSEQALADYAYLIQYLKGNSTGASDSPVIAFGGSYGGMLSSWFRMKYPNVVTGAIAASAPIWQTISDCDVFAQINTDTFKRANVLCPDIIRASWQIMNTLSKNEDGLKEIQTILKLCKPINSVDTLKDWLVDIYGNAAMSDYPYETKFLSPLPANPVSVMCDKITSIKSLSDPMDILIGIYEGINVYNNYTGNVPCFDIDSDTPSDINMGAWVYQVFTGLHSFFKKYHLGLIFGFRLQIYAYF
jgi:lysosomal Pro-X carboxypeptidase